jgi:hypothetical protein
VILSFVGETSVLKLSRFTGFSIKFKFLLLSPLTKLGYFVKGLEIIKLMDENGNFEFSIFFDVLGLIE